MLRHFRNLFVSKKHFYYNGICKICDRENENSLFISYFPCLHIKNLSPDNDFSHFSCDRFQRNCLSLKISSIDNVRIAVPAKASAKISFLCLLFESLFLRTADILFLFAIFSGRFFLFLFFLFRFFLGTHSCIFQYIFHFLLDLKNCIFSVFALLCLLKFHLHFQIHSASLAKHFVQIFYKDLTFFPGYHRVRKHHAKNVIIRKFYVRTLKEIVLQHIVIAQLKLHASPICFQKILRRILPGKNKLFNDSYRNRNSRKALSFNLFFQFKEMFFVNPSLTLYIDTNMRFCRIAGYLCNRHHIKKLFQLFIYL